MEIIYSATTSAWIGITDYKGHCVVVDDSYEYADCLERCKLFEGTYKECREYADNWERESRITW